MSNNAIVGILRALLTADTAEFDTAMKRSADGAKVWARDLKTIGQQATQVGQTLTAALTVPIVGLGVTATKAFSDFESSFAGVRKTVDASEEEFDAMEQQFRDLAKSIPVNVNELNRLGEAAGALGIPKAEVVDFARVMALLGVTTNLTADQAAESIAKVQNIFGAAGKDTERFASTLVALGNDGASTETQILEMAARIAGAGNTVHMTQGQVLAFASALASVGLEAEAGGSAISRVFIDIASAVSQGGSHLTDFAKVARMSTTEFAHVFKTDAASAVSAFVQGLGSIKQSGGDLLGTIDALGFSEIRVRDTLLRTAGAGDLLSRSLQLQSEAWGSNTALTVEAEKRFKTFQSQLDLLWNQIKDVGITLGEALMPVLKSVMETVREFVPWIAALAKGFAELPDWMKTTAIALAAVAAAVGPVLIIFGQMSTGLGAALGLFSKLAPALTAAGPLFTTLTAGVRTLSASLLALEINPIVLGLTLLTTAYFVLREELDKGTKSLRDNIQASKDKETIERLLHSKTALTAAQAEELKQAWDRQSSSIRKLADENLGMTEGFEITLEQSKNIAKQLNGGVAPAIKTTTDEQKSWNKAIKEGAAELSGATLIKDVAELAAKVTAVGGASKVWKSELPGLVKQIRDFEAAGAPIPKILQDVIARSREHVVILPQMEDGVAGLLDRFVQTGFILPDATDKVDGFFDALVPRLDQLTTYILPGAETAMMSFFDQLADKARHATAMETFVDSAKQYLSVELPKAIGQTLARAFEGGGDITGAIKSLATQIGSTLGGQLGLALGGPWGQALGESIGALAGPLTGAILKVFSGNTTKEAREAFARDMGMTLDQLYGKLQTMGAEGQRLANTALNVIGKHDEAGNKAWMDQVAKFFDEQKQRTDDLAKASAEAFAAAQEGIGNALGAIITGTIASQDEFDRLSRIALNTFNALVKSGVAPVDAMERIGGAVDALIANLEASGFAGGAAFAELARWRELTDKNRPLLEQVDALNQLMEMTETLGGLSAAAFVDLQAQGEAAYRQLLAAGFTEQEAQKQLAPLLEQILKLHEKKGYAIDEETQKVIDQARANGVLADQEMSTNQILQDGLSALIEAVGGQLPAAWKKATSAFGESARAVVSGAQQVASAINDTLGNLRFTVPVDFAVAGGEGLSFGAGSFELPSFRNGTRGEYVNFGQQGTLAMLHGEERVMTKGEREGGGAGLERRFDAMAATMDGLRRDLNDRIPMISSKAARDAALTLNTKRR